MITIIIIIIIIYFTMLLLDCLRKPRPSHLLPPGAAAGTVDCSVVRHAWA